MVDLIPKQKATYPLWFRLFSSLSVALFLLSIVAFFGLIYLQGQEEERAENLQELLSQKKLPQEIRAEEKVFGVKNRLEDFTAIVERRKDMRPFLTFFEENTHPQVYFSQFSLHAKNGAVSVAGQADSFRALDQQIQIFKEHEQVEEMMLSSMGFGEKGRVTFGFELKLPL